jgi:antagonist of KipI
MAFLVRRPGAASLLVDAGRSGWQHLGVPRGGPADRTSWILGNVLVGNAPATGALEIALSGPTLEATQRHRMVVFGAAFSTTLRKTTSPHLEHIPPGHVFTVDAGDQVHIGGLAAADGVRAYVCVSGGLTDEPVLASLSSLEPIKAGTTLECGVAERHSTPRWFRLTPWSDAPPPGVVRMVAGTHLKRSLRKLLLATTFKVSPDSNRMGLRLESTVAWPNNPSELVSAPVVPGTVQLPGGGQPIILGVDAQTIGGYPRLGHVIATDLDRLGQLRPEDTLRLLVVTLDEAERLLDSHGRWLQSWLQRLQHATP